MAKNKLIVAALLTVAGVGHAAAQASTPDNAPSAPGSSYHDAISRIEAEIMLLNKQQELRNAQRIANSGNTEQVIGVSLPRIINIVVSESDTTARVLHDSGLIRDIKVGDDIGGGIKVRSITGSAVSVTVRGKTENLSFVGTPAAMPPAQGGAPMPAPSFPGM